MLNNLARASKRQPIASKAKLFAAATPQRSLHTPIGNTRQKDEGYEVREEPTKIAREASPGFWANLNSWIVYGVAKACEKRAAICGHDQSKI